MKIWRLGSQALPVGGRRSVTPAIKPMTSDMSTFDPICFSSSENGSALWAMRGKPTGSGFTGRTEVVKRKPERMICCPVLFFCSRNQIALDRVDHPFLNTVLEPAHLVYWNNTFCRCSLSVNHDNVVLLRCSQILTIRTRNVRPYALLTKSLLRSNRSP